MTDFLTSAIVHVGNRGRGFFIRARDEESYVVTAAHCLPRLPEGVLDELRYVDIVGALGSAGRIGAELSFASHTEDIAVLNGCDEGYFDYVELTEQAGALSLGAPPPIIRPHLWTADNATEAWVLSLEGQWQKCALHNGGRWLVISEGAHLIKGGMSGSPILDADGAAIGVISWGGSSQSMSPSLGDCLPQWLVRELRIDE